MSSPQLLMVLFRAEHGDGLNPRQGGQSVHLLNDNLRHDSSLNHEVEDIDDITDNISIFYQNTFLWKYFGHLNTEPSRLDLKTFP